MSFAINRTLVNPFCTEPDFAFHDRQWGALLLLARLHEWKPAGTILETEPEWQGDYDLTQGQRVTDEDARNLADALERALPSIPVPEPSILPEARILPSIARGDSVKEADWFLGSQREQLQAFIDYAREGGFIIW